MMLGKILLKKYSLVTLIVLSLLISWPIFQPGYFFHHDDLQVMRIFEMRKCLEDFQIPCRWVPDMGYGNGYPLFNYYGVLPYYIGGVLSYLLGFVWAAKMLFLIPLILGPLAMFYLGKEVFGEKGGFVSAILYLFAPYRALDIYVRGAISEVFAISIVPLVFYFSLRLIKQKSLLNFIGFSLSLGLFLLCHNIMTLFFVPVLTVWILYLLIKEKFRNLKEIILGILLGIGLSAFFIIPAFEETSLIQAYTLLRGGTDFRAHFVAVGQLFLDRSWGYGGSVFGSNDTISFQIGWPHWWVVVAALITVLLKFKVQNPKFKVDLFLTFFLSMTFLLSIFMMHNKSTPIWDAIEPLQYAQFPWRILSLTIFSASLLGGLFIVMLKKELQIPVIILISILSFVFNWQFFRPKDFYPWVDDNVKLSDPLWEIQQKAGILDYLPKTAYEPFSRAENYPAVREGKAEISNYLVRSNSFSFKSIVQDYAAIDVPIFDFPNWQTYVNGKIYTHSDKGFIGRIKIDLPPGSYEVRGILKDTLVRTVSNLISLASIFIISALIIFRKKFFRQ